MSYVGIIPSFGEAQDPYDLSMCFPQYLDEAKEIVAEIRGHVNTIRAWDPAAAKSLDDELINLIAMHRSSNACPNVSITNMGFLHQTETQGLLDKARRLAASPPPPPAVAQPTAQPTSSSTAWSQPTASTGVPATTATTASSQSVVATAMPALGPVLDMDIDPAYIDQQADDSMMLFGIGALILLGAVVTGIVLWLRR